MAIDDDIEALVLRCPGLTQAQIASELFGGNPGLQRVKSSCRSLVDKRRIERQGHAGYEAFTYHPWGSKAGGE
jgi:hypothetical protein